MIILDDDKLSCIVGGNSSDLGSRNCLNASEVALSHASTNACFPE